MLACPPVVQPGCPTLAGFQDFITNIMGIAPKYLEPTNPAIQFSFDFALTIVNRTFQVVSPFAYNVMVYNLAGHNLLMFAGDIPGVFYVNPDGSEHMSAEGQPIGYFGYIRQSMDLNGFPPGIVQSTADETTSASFVVPDAMKNLSFQDLETARTPWGRRYLGLAQSYGAIGGIS